MSSQPPSTQASIASWQRRIITAAAVSSTLLIAMGGILCVTHFIRTCPDWPGCFGRLVPPAQTGAILEYTHRLLAAISAILILSAAIIGLIRTSRMRWLVIPPWISVLLLVEVSYFGAQVVLRGLAPGWAAVDVGSALLVVALMVTCALVANTIQKNPGSEVKLSYRGTPGGLAISATVVTYLVLVSGVLVAGNNSITGCLGWPVYSLRLLQADLHPLLKIARWVVSIVGIALIVALVVRSWRTSSERPAVYSYARWVGILLLVEAIIQIALLVFNLPTYLLVGYTITMAVLWAMLAGLLVTIGLEEGRKSNHS